MISIINYLFEGKIKEMFNKAKQGYSNFEERLGKETVGAVKDIKNNISNTVNDIRGKNYKIQR